MKKTISIALFYSMLLVSAGAQPAGTMDFEKYDPVSNLVVPEHPLSRAKFPFIDVHNHQWNMGSQDLGGLVTEMDKLNMAVMVNLSGSYGNGLSKMTANINQIFPGALLYLPISISQGWVNPAGRKKP